MLKNWLETMLTYKMKYKKDQNNKDYEDINFNLLKCVTDRFELNDGYIDDITWNDLEMNKVFTKLNGTYTLCGEELLYYWMKTPTQNSHDFLKRQEKLNYAKSYDDSLKTDLDTVGTYDYDYRNVVLNNKPEVTRDKKPFIIYSSLFLMILLYSLSGLSVFLFGVCFSVLAIILFHYVYTLNNKYKLNSFAYIVKIASFYVKNSSLIKSVYSEEYNLNKLESVVEQIIKFDDAFNQLEGLNPLKDIGIVLTLSTYIKCIRMEKIVCQNKNEILNIADILGEIDLSQAIDKYKNNNHTSQPVLSDDLETLELEDAYNILIEGCVRNNVEIKNSIVITGSNMGGKSSFLRQVGISIMLSQSLCFSLSTKHTGGFFTVMSSISLNDDIESGKSYFMKEAEAIQRMLDQDVGKQNTLMLIDEMFKGTNPIERLAASVEILNRLSAHYKVIVTTHDIGILSDLNNFEFYHFEHNISKEKMEFDYKIKLGITEVRNAVKLMEYIEYPKELINSINDRILRMNSIV